MGIAALSKNKINFSTSATSTPPLLNTLNDVSMQAIEPLTSSEKEPIQQLQQEKQRDINKANDNEKINKFKNDYLSNTNKNIDNNFITEQNSSSPDKIIETTLLTTDENTNNNDINLSISEKNSNDIRTVAENNEYGTKMVAIPSTNSKNISTSTTSGDSNGIIANNNENTSSTIIPIKMREASLKVNGTPNANAVGIDNMAYNRE